MRASAFSKNHFWTLHKHALNQKRNDKCGTSEMLSAQALIVKSLIAVETPVAGIPTILLTAILHYQFFGFDVALREYVEQGGR